jgi:hypothetical protein
MCEGESSCRVLKSIADREKGHSYNLRVNVLLSLYGTACTGMSVYIVYSAHYDKVKLLCNITKIHYSIIYARSFYTASIFFGVIRFLKKFWC